MHCQDYWWVCWGSTLQLTKMRIVDKGAEEGVGGRQREALTRH
jgi:hypothetical protein